MFPVCRRTIVFREGVFFNIVKLFFQKKLLRGEHINLFVNKFSEYTGIKFAIPTQTGRSALSVILCSLNFPRDAEIIIPALEDLSVPEIVRKCGLTPVFADIDYDNQNINIDALKGKITEKTVAIIVAHIFGNPCDITRIKELVRGRDILIIEDCAHAMGSRIHGQHVGNSGDISFFSFYTTKPFMCFGGGMIATNNEILFERIKKEADKFIYPDKINVLQKILTGYLLYLISSRIGFALFTFPFLILVSLLQIETLGIYGKIFKPAGNAKIKNFKFTNIQAFIGLENLENLNKNLAIRKQNAHVLDKLLSDEIKRVKFLTDCNYYFYVIFSKEKEKIINSLLKKGLDTGKNIMRNCPFHYGAKDTFRNVNTFIELGIQIPIHENISRGQAIRIAEAINNIFMKYGVTKLS